MSAAAVSFINGKGIVLSINGALSVLDPLLESLCVIMNTKDQKYTPISSSALNLTRLDTIDVKGFHINNKILHESGLINVMFMDNH